MAIEIVVPRLGWSMDEGTFGQWLKRDGEFVERGQALFVLEGEKSAQDIESFDGGILRIPPDAPQTGDTVIYKTRYSGFYGTSLDAVLRQREAKWLLVTGCTTNVCVDPVGYDCRSKAAHDGSLSHL